MKQVEYLGGLGVSQTDIVLGNEAGRVSRGLGVSPADMLLGNEAGRVSRGSRGLPSRHVTR